MNAPFVDNSCKWAGGGLLSNVHDLVQFGNAMLYSSQFKEEAEESNKASSSSSDNQPSGKKPKQRLPGYLKPETMAQIWEPIIRMGKPESLSDAAYGMGWMVVPKHKEKAFCRDQRFMSFHTGGAVGASSVLLLLPAEGDSSSSKENGIPPRGVVVAVLCNMEGVSLTKLALDVAKAFEAAGKVPEWSYKLQDL